MPECRGLIHARAETSEIFFPFSHREALLLSTAWFTDIYLDISGEPGNLSTVSEFSSVDHGFRGQGVQSCVDQLKPIYQLKITCIKVSKTHLQFSYQYILLTDQTYLCANSAFNSGMNHNTLAGWCVLMSGCSGIQPLALRAPLIPQIHFGVHRHREPAESSLSLLPVAHTGSGALICLPGSVPEVGARAQGYYGNSPIVPYSS